jgi:hypothetical protein
MNLPAFLYLLRWLVRDTFRQARASGLTWLMLGASGLCILFCLSVGLHGGEALMPPGEIELDPVHGRLTLGFGAFDGPLFRDGAAAVHFMQVLLAEGVAGVGGTLLALIWTAGFLPGFLEPQTASVLLTKPCPRWVLLVGKFLGVVAFVFLFALLFIGGTWVALGLKTGYWEPAYLACAFLLPLHFAAIYSFSALLAVCTRGPIPALFGSLLFWIVCWGIDFGRYFAKAEPSMRDGQATLSPLTRGLAEAAYWILPKPADFQLLLHQLLHSREHLALSPVLAHALDTGLFMPELSLITSFLFCIAMLAAAAHHLATTDY